MSIITGNQGSNTLTGTGSDDLIVGLGGNDTINAGAGNDIVSAGDGNDTVDGGAGSDVIDGGAGNDKLSGGAGSDVIVGGAGNDTIDGGSGSDCVSGGAGNDTLVYQVSENAGSFDLYNGGSGNDTLRILATAAQASASGFLSDIAELRALIARYGSASTYLDSLGLAVTSIEKVEVVIVPGSGNNAPTAGGDTINTTEDNAITIPASALLGNDSDPDGNALTLHSVQAATNGTVQLLASGEVVFTPAANFSGAASFTYTVRDTAGATSTATVVVNVAPVADAPQLAASNATGLEDTDIALNISASLTDTSESLSVTVTGVPADATLSAGTKNLDGTWTLSAEQLSGLTLRAPDDFSGTIQLGVTATSIESNGTKTNSSTTISVDVTPVADAPQLIVSNAAGDEDTAVALDINAFLEDASETLSVTITGVPVGFALSAGTQNPDGTWTLSAGQWDNLTLSTPEDFSGTLELEVTATSTESNGTKALTSANLTVTVEGVADVPDVGALSPTIDAQSSDDEIPLGLTLAPHGDLSETLTVQIQGVPPAWSLSSGDYLGDGAWSVPAESLATLSLIHAGAGDAPVGVIALKVVVTAQDGTSIATDSVDITIEVSSPEPERRLVDGYIVGATVFSDTDRDGILDEGEAFAVTGEGGTFTLVGDIDEDAPLVSIGGIDVSTGLPFEGVLTAPGGSTVVTPLTTLVQALIEASVAANDPEDPLSPPPLTVEQANALVADALGIAEPEGGFTSFDPVPAASEGDEDATAILSAAIQVQATISQISAAVGGEGGAVASALAQVIFETETLNLTDTTTLGDIIEDVAPENSSTLALESLTNVVLAANQAIDTASAVGVGALAQAANVALGQTTEQLASAGLDPEALDNVELNNTGEALDDAIAEAEIPDAFQVGTLGNDVLNGGAGVDVIEGLDGNDQINGQAGNDTLSGGAGNDILVGGIGNDLLDGGAGQDRAVYSSEVGPINVLLAEGRVTGNGNEDTLRSVESVVGTALADTYDARGYSATSANAGSVTFAGTVNNTFEGGAGNDDIEGNGRTTISYRSATGGVTVDVLAGTASGDASVGIDTFRNASFVVGSAHNDTMSGSNSTQQSDFFVGLGGNDVLDGRGGFDFASYNFETVTGGVTVDMTAGTVSGDASTGSDTLRSIEAVRGTNFADSYNAVNFGSGANVGSNGNFNEFEGMGGNDTVVGNGNTRISFTNASGGVTVDLALASNQVTGDASVGTDTVSGISQVRGSNFDDTIRGTNGGNDFFDGRAGNDLLDGRGGFDQVVYNTDALVTGGISVDMASGVVTGNATIGADTLRSIEQVTGTNFDDTYVATGFGSASTNAGSSGTFNSFQGGGGNDTITGNGNTQISYGGASGAVTVNLSTGSATGAGVGTDSITVGTVNNVFGSSFGDTLIGGSLNETFTGGVGNSFNGNDSIDGGTGTDMAVFSGPVGQYSTVTATTVSDTNGNRDGTDTLSNIELLQFGSGGGAAYRLVASGSSANAIDISGFGLSGTAGLQSLTGANTDDYLTIGTNFFGRPINLGGGTNDTVNLGFAGAFYTLTLVGVEVLNGANLNENVTLTGLTTGLAVDLGIGNDTLNLATGANSLSLTGVEQLFVAGSNNTLTLLNGVSGLAVNLGGGSNTLNLNGTTNALTSVFGVQTIVGTTSSDTLTLSNGAPNMTVDMGAGSNDVLNVGNNHQLTLSGVETLNLTNGASSLSAVGVQTITAGDANDTVQMVSLLTGVSVNLGGGTDTLVLANGSNSVSVAGVEQIQASDFGAGSDDTLTLQNTVAGVSVNLGNGTNTLNLTGGVNQFVDVNFAGTINGSTDADDLAITGNLFGGPGAITINLGDGIDTLTVGAQNTAFSAVGIEQITGNAQDNHFTIQNNVTGLSVDLGDGNDTLLLSGGASTVAVTNVENLHAADWQVGSTPIDDTLTLANIANGVNVNLFQGNNTLNLADGVNTLGSLNEVGTVNGGSGNDVLTLAGQVFNTGGSIAINLGGGSGDVLNLTGGFTTIVTTGVETVNGSATGDDIQLTTGATVTGGGGADFVTASNDADAFRYTATSQSATGAGHDQITGFDASEDVFTFSGVSGLASPINFVGTGPFIAGGPQVRLAGSTLQIDVDGDTTADMEIDLVNPTGGALTNANFVVEGAVNQPPSAVTLNNMVTSLAENTATTSSIRVADIVVTDDGFGFNALSLTGTHAGLFEIVGSELRLRANVTLDFEAQSTLDVTVVVDDAAAGGSPDAMASFSLSITDVNEAPTAVSLENVVTMLPENTSVATRVADIVVTDDALGTNMLSLTGADAALFEIVGNELRLRANAPLNFEGDSTLEVNVVVDDPTVGGGEDAVVPFTLTLTDVNEAPTAVSLDNVVTTLPEDTSVATRVADIVVTDDALGTNTLSLTGADAALFEIVGNELRLRANAPLNFEGDSTLEVYVVVDDPTVGGAQDAIVPFTLTLTDVNEAPTAVSLHDTVTTLAENTSTASAIRVADIVISDDALGTNALSLTGADAAFFEIVGSELRLRANTSLNFEAGSVLNVTVVVNDASVGGPVDASLPFSLTLTDVNEAPTDITLSNASVDENSAAGFVVGTLSAADVDASESFTFSLLNNAGGRFAISGSNLVVAGSLDFESATSHQVEVQVTDAGGLTYNETFTIAVNNLAEGEILGDGDNNILNGTSNDDTIRGFAGNDTLNGFEGNDLLDGGAGNDVMTGGIGNDTLNGGGGQDVANFSDVAGPITVQLDTGIVTGTGFTDTLLSVESVIGTSAADTFNVGTYGAGSANAGSVTFAGTVNNTFEGGGGNDIINGNGRTTLSFRSATAGVTVDVLAGTAIGGDASVGTDTFSNTTFFVGSAHNDTMRGGNSTQQSDFFVGLGGDDLLDGRGGFDFASYSFETVSGSITVNMAAGTVTGDASTGTDTLRSIEAVRGTNGADSYTATGFSNLSTNAGSNGNFNEFEGMGGNDTVVGNGNTRISFTNASGGVIVDLALASNQVTGDASVGTDTVSGISQVRGSNFDDTIRGTNGGNDFFDGRAGNDLLDGRGGFDQVTYSADALVTAGVSIDMASGIVTGNATIGIDTLRSIEQVTGTSFADTYVATGFSSSSANAGSSGTFNSFQGGGGNDTITGNGNTQISYGGASGAVIVDLSTGSASGSGVGTDTITVATVNNVFGSNFGDTLIGGSLNETFIGGGGGTFNGNDSINGGAGTDMAVFNGAVGDYSAITATTVTDTNANGDGSDTLSNIELLQFGSGGGTAYRLVASGSSGNTVDISGFSLGGNSAITTLTGTADDHVTIGTNLFGRALNLGDGTDTVYLAVANANYSLNLIGVEALNGAGGNENVTLSTAAAMGMTIDLGAGTNDQLTLVTGASSLNLSGVEQLMVNGSNNALTLLNDVSGLNINLGGGTNTLNLNGATNSLTGVFGVQTINGSNSDDTLTISNGLSTATINLGIGNDDVLNVGNNHQLTLSGVETLNLTNGASSLSATGVQTITGAGANDTVQMTSLLAGVTVNLGGGSDTLVLANGSNSVSVTDVEQIQASDFGPGNVSDDTLTLQNAVTGVSVNLGNGTNTLHLTGGVNQFVDVNFAGTVSGGTGNDDLAIIGNLFGGSGAITIDLGGGTDTLTLGAQNISFGAIGIEQVTGNAQDNHFSISNTIIGMAVDLGDGTDTLVLASGANTVAITSVETVNATDFNNPASDDTLTFANTVNGVNVNLFQGNNTLNLANGVNTLGSVSNVGTVNGGTGNDVLTLAGQVFNTGGSIAINLGGGTGDVLNLTGNLATVVTTGVESVNGSAFGDNVQLTTGTTVTGGGGADLITASLEADTFRFTSASESTGGGLRDVIANFDAEDDVFAFAGVSGLDEEIQFIASGGFTATGGPEALLVGSVLQIDVDGDGLVGIGDMEIELTGLQGTLSSSNFSLL